MLERRRMNRREAISLLLQNLEKLPTKWESVWVPKKGQQNE